MEPSSEGGIGGGGDEAVVEGGREGISHAGKRAADGRAGEEFKRVGRDEKDKGRGGGTREGGDRRGDRSNEDGRMVHEHLPGGDGGEGRGRGRRADKEGEGGNERSKERGNRVWGGEISEPGR